MEKEKKKMGRPTDNLKNKRLEIRISEKDLNVLNECSDILGKSRANVIVDSVKKTYEELRKGK